MGQKVNPVGLRLNVNKTWDSRWFADKNYAANIDHFVAQFLDVLDERYLEDITQMITADSNAHGKKTSNNMVCLL